MLRRPNLAATALGRSKGRIDIALGLLYLRHVLEHVATHPINRIDELLPWRVAGLLSRALLQEHGQMIEWIGYPFNPAAFDINAVNQRLARIKA
jgi:hypothetical protein